MFSLIACVDNNNKLGDWRIKEDMQFFKKTTTGHKVVMGGSTSRTIGKPLPDRENFVISRGKTNIPGVTKLPSPDVDFNEWKQSDEEIFIIGGGQVYSMFYKHAKKCYLTRTKLYAPLSAPVFYFSAFFSKANVLEGKFSLEIIPINSRELFETLIYTVL